MLQTEILNSLVPKLRPLMSMSEAYDLIIDKIKEQQAEIESLSLEFDEYRVKTREVIEQVLKHEKHIFDISDCMGASLSTIHKLDCWLKENK